MIEFTCVQCGRVHERPAEEAGTTAYCDCGQPNRVPWGARKPGNLEPVVELDPEALVLEATPTASSANSDPEVADVCFQHEDISATETCADCGVRFCAGCVVRLQGVVLCGPCKNLRLRRLQRPTQISVPAIIATILALCGAPVGLCITGVAEQAGESLVGFMGAIVPFAGLVLGTVALLQIERDPKRSGRSLAITGIVAGLVGALLSVLVATFMHE